MSEINTGNNNIELSQTPEQQLATDARDFLMELEQNSMPTNDLLALGLKLVVRKAGGVLYHLNLMGN